mgnify:CR=1 FL=1
MRTLFCVTFTFWLFVVTDSVHLSAAVASEDVNYIDPQNIVVHSDTMSATKEAILYGVCRCIIDEILVYGYDDFFDIEFFDVYVLIYDIWNCELESGEVLYPLYSFASVYRKGFYLMPNGLYIIGGEDYIRKYEIPSHESGIYCAESMDDRKRAEFLTKGIRVTLRLDSDERDAAITRQRERYNYGYADITSMTLEEWIDSIRRMKECVYNSRVILMLETEKLKRRRTETESVAPSAVQEDSNLSDISDCSATQ